MQENATRPTLDGASWNAHRKAFQSAFVARWTAATVIRRIAAANVMLVFQYAVAAFVPLLLTPHVVRSLGLEHYGQLAAAMAWGGYGAIVVHFAFPLVGPRRLAQLRPEESPAQVFWELTAAKFLLLTVLLPLLWAAAAFSTSDFSGIAEWVALFGLPLAASLNSAWFLQGRGRFLHACVAAMFGSAATLAIGFAFVKGDDPRSMAAAAVATVGGLLLASILTLAFSQSSLFRQSVRWSDVRPTRSLQEGAPLFASQFVSSLYTTSGPIVILYLVGAREAGAYSAVERIICVLIHAGLLTHAAAYPSLAASFSADRAAYRRLLQFVLGAYLAMTGVLSVVTWMCRDRLARFLFGTSAGDFDMLLAWGLAWLVVAIGGTALTGYLTVSGRSREVLPLTLRCLVVSVALGVPGVLLFGAAGWMAAMVTSQLFVLSAAFFIWRTSHAA